jgi:hypothetical protein
VRSRTNKNKAQWKPGTKDQEQSKTRKQGKAGPTAKMLFFQYLNKKKYAYN